MKNHIVVDGVTYYAHESLPDETMFIELKEFSCEILSRIADLKSRARDLYEDYEKAKLTASMIEAEGYLRAAIEIGETAEYVTTWFPEFKSWLESRRSSN